MKSKRRIMVFPLSRKLGQQDRFGARDAADIHRPSSALRRDPGSQTSYPVTLHHNYAWTDFPMEEGNLR